MGIQGLARISTNKTKKGTDKSVPLIFISSTMTRSVNSCRRQFMKALPSIHAIFDCNSLTKWLFFKFDEFNAGVFQELDGEFVGVGVLVDDAFDATVDDDTCADCAGLVGDVDGCTFNRHTKF